MNVLIIDDILAYRVRFEEQFSRLGHNAIHASNGLDAISYIKNQKIDLIVLDYCMPHMTGFEFLESLRQDPLCRTIPVIMASSDISKNLQAIAQYGCLGYLNKPAHDDEIENLLKEIF